MSSFSSLVVHWIQSYGYMGVFFTMLFESACIPIPSEVIMPFGGYLAWAGHLQLWGVIFAGTLGNIAGSLVAYYVGKLGGREVIHRYGRFVHISDRHLKLAEDWFARRGEWAVFIGRMLPGIRTFISLPAGIANMSVTRFTLLTALGSFPWVTALAFSGFKLGQNWEGIKHYTHPLTYLVAVCLVVFLVFVLIKKRKQIQ